MATTLHSLPNLALYFDPADAMLLIQKDAISTRPSHVPTPRCQLAGRRSMYSMYLPRPPTSGRRLSPEQKYTLRRLQGHGPTGRQRRRNTCIKCRGHRTLPVRPAPSRLHINTYRTMTCASAACDHHNVRDTRAEPGTDSTTEISPDVEIKYLRQDRLGRADFSRRIAKRIRRAGDGPSVVFGLAGPWGSGKSSVLNMITEVLEETHSDYWSVVSFTPWSAGDPLALTEEFYNAIASAMPTSPDGETAKRLLAAAAPAGAAALKVLGTSLVEKYVGKGFVKDALDAVTDTVADQAGDFVSDVEPDPFSRRFTKISEAIGKTGKNFLVIVDDVDRLHSDELLSVMKAVRLLGRFDRVHYLLSYDEETVIDVLVETDLARAKRRRASKYLEKIVQYPFVLPPIQMQRLATEFRDQLRGIATMRHFCRTPTASPMTRVKTSLTASSLSFRQTASRCAASTDCVIRSTSCSHSSAAPSWTCSTPP